MKASIDIGSNSVLLLVKNNDQIIENLANVTGLGKGIDKTKKFAKESMDETYRVLAQYKDTIVKHGLSPESVIVTATEASRVVTNAQDFFSKVKKEIGFKIRIISGEQEAYYSTKGVLSSGYNNEVVSIMDIGGASTELIKVKLNPFEILDFISMPIGAVRVNDAEDKISYIDEILRRYNLKPYSGEIMLATAGTMTSLGAMLLGLKEYNDDKVHDSNFSMDSLESLGESILNMDESKLDHTFPFLEKRRFTICSGYLIAKEVMQRMGFNEFTVSSRGLRYGTIDMESE